jgi:molybdopterin-guanine dinucleotide biosynthesis protein A
MGEDKAFIKVDGEVLWRRQLAILRALEPRELFVAGPERDEWRDAGAIVLADAIPDTGPLGGLVSGLRRCRAPLLLVLAVDLPRMTSSYLAQLVNHGFGVVPRGHPLAAIYPKAAMAVAESCLASGDVAMQEFARRCAAEGLVRLEEVAPADEALFLNMNTPEDRLALAHA